MTRKFCDICGKAIDTSENYEYKVKVKNKICGWGDSWWKKLEICEFCKKAIVLKSKELRRTEKVSK